MKIDPAPLPLNDRCVFLGSPSEIESAIADLAKKSQNMKVAVAYISPHWRSVFADYTGTVEVICWLDSTNTNPYAVEEMMQNVSFAVKQAHSMHAKVYLASGIGAVVGSANLSSTALSDSDTAGQYEAAVLVKDVRVVQQITDWFDKLWTSSNVRDIEEDDLKRAQIAFDKKPPRGTVISANSAANLGMSPSAVSNTRTWTRMFPPLSSAEVPGVLAKRQRNFKKYGQWFKPRKGNYHQNVYNELVHGRERNLKSYFTDASRFGGNVEKVKLRFISRLGDATGDFVIERAGDFVRLRNR